MLLGKGIRPEVGNEGTVLNDDFTRKRKQRKMKFGAFGNRAKLAVNTSNFYISTEPGTLVPILNKIYT